MREFSYIGNGLYTFSQVSLYTGINSRKISRWTKGYTGKGTKPHTSLYQPDYTPIRSFGSLSFLDLIEVRFIDAFHKHGVSWKAIRIAAEKAKIILGQDHPFSTRKFYTDRKSILSRIAVSEHETELLNLVNSQYELDEILKPYLIEGIDYTDMDTAMRWHPLGNNRSIVIDPKINFGRPVVVGPNVDTRLLFDLYRKKKSVEEIAFWYEIAPMVVEQAISYEEMLAA